jgi:AcrR family transcriptional regulator
MRDAPLPASDCEIIRDPRIRRTRQSLQSALKALMQTRNFEEISVQEITDAAMVNRATFYDHYTDKYALLDAQVAWEFYGFLEQRGVAYDASCPVKAEALVRATCDFLVVSHEGSAACGKQSAFWPLIDAAIASAIRHVLARGIVNREPGVASPAALPGGLPRDMVATAASWAIYGAVKEWFHTPNRRPAAEIAPEIVRLVLPILEASGRVSEPVAKA